MNKLKITSAALCIIAAVSLAMPIFTGSVQSSKLQMAAAGSEIYNSDDVIVIVYIISCKSGIAGFNMALTYDGDNLDALCTQTSAGFSSVMNDNSVGHMDIGVMDFSSNENHIYPKKTKLAVCFKSLYMVQSDYLKYKHSVSNFVNGKLSEDTEIEISEEYYVYKDDPNDLEEYLKELLVCEPDSNSDTDTDTETDTDTTTDTDTEIDTDTHSDTDTESDTDTSTDTPAAPFKGDVDLDGEITAVDSLYVLRASVRLETLEGELFEAADYDEDGSITANDSIMILRKSVDL